MAGTKKAVLKAKKKSLADSMDVDSAPKMVTDKVVAMDTDGGEKPLDVYLPGMKLEEGEELEVDPSAYVMLHSLNMEWPSLSFDIIGDDLGSERTTFPMSSMFVTGTQANNADKNYLFLAKCTNLHKTRQKITETSDDHEEGSESESDDENEESLGTKKDPLYCGIKIKHDGAVNRVKSIKKNENHLAASWSEKGFVQVWNISDAVRQLESMEASLLKNNNLRASHRVNHDVEGYALAWNQSDFGKLLTGDCSGSIKATNTLDSSTAMQTFTGHQDSVEDMQWSPNELTVFASCSVDKTVKLWDLRVPSHALSATLHKTDINVLSWNPLEPNQLATGADDGIFSCWDLRKLDPMHALSTFEWHRSAITSIEWSPHDPSLLAVSGADDQVSIWDMSIEEAHIKDIPKELLFIHQGQVDIKEVHWHPQLSGVLISTASSGFNIFKTISV